MYVMLVDDTLGPLDETILGTCVFLGGGELGLCVFYWISGI